MRRMRRLGSVLMSRPVVWLLLQALALLAVGAAVATAISWRGAGGSVVWGERLRLGLLLAGGVVFVPWALVLRPAAAVSFCTI